MILLKIIIIIKNKYIIVVVLGDVSVGKTNLILRIIGEDFVPTQATIGTEFKFRNINVDENKIQIQIWDTCKKIYIKIFKLYI